MNQNKQNELKKEIKTIGMIFVIAYVFFQIHYFKESPINVLRLVFAHFYLFILPGYSLMLYYFNKIQFAYRFFIGLMLGYGTVSMLSYFITLIFHINLKEYYLFVPIALVFIGYNLAKKELDIK